MTSQAKIPIYKTKTKTKTSKMCLKTVLRQDTVSRRNITAYKHDYTEIAWTWVERRYWELATSKSNQVVEAVSCGMVDIPNVWRHKPTGGVRANHRTSGISCWQNLATVVLIRQHNVTYFPLSVTSHKLPRCTFKCRHTVLHWFIPPSHSYRISTMDVYRGIT